MSNEPPSAVPGFSHYPLPVAVKAEGSTSTTSNTNPHSSVFLNPDQPFPAPVGNPVLRGRLLTIANAAVSNLPFVAKFLYANAGFAGLADVPNLSKLDPRYDPTVVPIGHSYHSVDDDDVTTAEKEGPVFQTSDPPKDPFHSIADFHQAYLRNEFTPSDVADAILTVLENPAEPIRRAFIHLRPDLVREAAAASTSRWKSGKTLGKLDGVPFAVKDEFDVKGYPRTYGTKLNFPAITKPVDEKATSWGVQKLMDEGAVVVGITNMHELGIDTCNSNPHYGTPPNPYAPGHFYPGGSSGGSASVVGSGLVPFAIGADAGGSIRIPSAFCGVYGLKPSHGRISAHPTASGATTTGVIGPIAGTIQDLAHVYSVMSKWDSSSGLPEFPVRIPQSICLNPGYQAKSGPHILGIYRPWFDSADESVRKACYAAIDGLVKTGNFQTVDIELPNVLAGGASHAVTVMSELNSSFNILVNEYASLSSSATASSNNLLPVSRKNLSPSSRMVMSVGTVSPAIDWLTAQRIRALIMGHLSSLFRKYSPAEGKASKLIVVTPTVAAAGWPIQQADLSHGLSNGDMTMKVMRYIWLSNFTGCPSITAPVGYSAASAVPDAQVGILDDELVPIGLLGMAEWGNEYAALEFGIALHHLLARSGKTRVEVENMAADVDRSHGRKIPKLWMDVFDLARQQAKLSNLNTDLVSVMG